MARQRPPIKFKTDRGLEIAVENAAFGLSITGRQTRTRKYKSSLEKISEEMAREAKQMAMQQPSRARRSDGGLSKIAARHPFDRSNPRRDGYIKSIEAQPVTRVRGHMAISITAKHSNADDVEYGNAGGVVKKVRSTGKRFTIPIHKWRYDQFQKSRNMKIADRRDKGWPSASKEQRKIYSDKANAQRRLARKITRGKSVKGRTSTFTKARTARSLAVARQLNASRVASKRLSAVAGSARVIPMRGASGRYYIAVTSFETYAEYAILRRAMRRIAIRRFE